MKLFVKHMVSDRCKMAVKDCLDKLGLPFTAVMLGVVDTRGEITSRQRDDLDRALKKIGLELLISKRSILVERIKLLIIELVHYTDDRMRQNLSDYMSQKLGYDYTYLANVFSETNGTTIEHFFIAQRIEMAKELIEYDELNLTEIADKLHFSSVSHLSSQFKKVTGATPSYFKHFNIRQRTALENV